MHFGASTRIYILRERPNPMYNSNATSNDQINLDVTGLDLNRSMLDTSGHKDSKFSFGHLPHTEVELDNLTEFNTAHNRRITSLIDVSKSKPVGRSNSKRGYVNVHFSDADEVINPEDVDPSIGRFRNLVQETFIPNKVCFV